MHNLLMALKTRISNNWCSDQFNVAAVARMFYFSELLPVCHSQIKNLKSCVKIFYRLVIMKDRKGINRGKCKKCDCDEYLVEKSILCAYCEHTPFAHGESFVLFFI
jgi:hypothetical protein